MGLLRFGAVLCLAAMSCATPGAADELSSETAFKQSQAAIGNQTGNHVLRDHRARALALRDLRGKPLVVSLVYTSCATVCPLVTDYLAGSVEEARKVLGTDSFNILTFGFDAGGDRPAQLAGFARNHGLTRIDGWYVASADDATVEAFLSELGFSFTAAAGGYAHVTQTTVLDADGVVYRQIYGESFPLPMLLEPLKDLALGRTTQSFAPEDLWNRLTFLCTVYDPATGSYRFDYGIAFGAFFGALSLILFGWVIVRLWLERRRALRRPPVPRGPEAV